MSMRRLVQYRAADGSIQERQVDLMFPATERTVLRLVQAWWERKVSPFQGISMQGSSWCLVSQLPPKNSMFV
jgi:hypothetical protein